jgi:hypothetical protein
MSANGANGPAITTRLAGLDISPPSSATTEKDHHDHPCVMPTPAVRQELEVDM